MLPFHLPTFPILIATFAGFASTVFAQMWIADRVKRRLVDRHPELWLKLSRESSIFTQNPAYRFLRRGQYRGLDDPAIAKLAKRQKLIFGISLIFWLAWMAEILLLSQP